MIRRKEQCRGSQSVNRRRSRSAGRPVRRWAGPRLEPLEQRHLLTAVTLGGGNEPFIAVDPFNPENVVVGANGLGAMFSTDRGETFTGPSVPVNYGGDPGLAIDSGGRVFFSYLLPDAVIAADLDIGVSNTTFALQDFSTNQVVVSNPEDAADAGLGDDDDKELIAADYFTTSPFRDNVYVAWRELNNEDLLFARSTDNGATFSAPTSLATPVNSFLSGADPEVGPNGEVYVMYWDGSNMGGDVGEVRVVKSTDGGVTFFNPVSGGGAISAPAGTAGLDATGLDHNAGLMRNQPPNQSFRWDVRTMIDIEADPLRAGNVYATWLTDPDGTTAGDASNVLFSRSTDGGVNWSSPVVLNDDGGSLTQHMPSIAVDEAGNLAAIWYDERLSPNTNDPILSIFATVSLDGGLTWSPNILLDDSTFDPDSGGANTFIGDYIQVAAADGTAFAAWTHTDGAGANQIRVEKFSMLAAFQDRFEPNNSQGNATVLGSEKKITLRDLTIHNEDDVDFFKITAQDTGKLIINAFFDDEIGDLDITVLDANGNLLGSSTSTNDNEKIVLPVVSQEMYFLRVSGFDDATNHYDLEIENFEVRTPTGVHLDPTSDTGMMRNDNYTADNTPRMVIQADLSNFANMGIVVRDAAGAAALLPGAVVEVTITNSITGASFSGFADPIGASTTLFEFTPTAILLDGTYFASAAVRIFDGQRDNGGVLIDTSDRGQLSEPLWFTVDTTAPEPATKDLIDSSDTGMLNDDNVTNKMSPAFAGIAEAGAKIRVLANGQTVGNGVVNTNGEWEVTVEPLADGVYEISTQVEDLAGNVTQSNGLTIWIDTVAPNTPLLDLVTDSGRDDADNVTNVNTPTVTITADDTPTGGLNPFPNDIKYRLFDRPGNALGEVLLIDSFTGIPGFTDGGFFAHTLSRLLNDDFDGMIDGTPLADGVHNLKLEVEDRAGNISHDFLLEITIDTVAPAAAITGIDPAETDTGVGSQQPTFADRITSDTATGFFGTAEADSIVRMWADGAPISDGVVDASDSFQGLAVAIPLDGNQGFPDGQWNLTGRFDLNDPNHFPLDGTRQISVTAEDLAGNIGELDTLDIFIDTQGPRVADVFITDDPLTVEDESLFDLFDPKPSAGPTPLVDRLSIKFTDLPVRTQQFLYEAVNQQVATNVGNYQLVGDQVGHILIEQVLIENMTTASAGVSVAGGSGAVIIDGGDRDDHGSFDGTNNVDGWQFIEQMVGFADAGVLNGATNDVLVIGATAGDALDAINSAASALGLTTTVITGADITTTNFSEYRIMYVPSDAGNTSGGITDADLALLTARKADVQSFVNTGGSLVALTQEDAATPYSWLELPDPFTIGSPDTDTQYQTQALIDAGLVITNTELTNGTPLHNTFTGPPGFNGLVPFVYNVGANGTVEDGGGDDQIITLGLASGSIGIGAMPAMSTVTLVFAEPLPDDRYSLLVRDSIVDDAGNALDGESQVASPDDDPVFPSGDGQPGGPFMARFTVDSRPEIGTYCCGSVYVDINGNKIFDPEGQDNDQTNRDLVFNFGNSADALFAGQFTAGGLSNGFDRLGAYGFDGVYRFLLDLNDDGVADVNIASAAQVNAAPIAGNFDGNAANGDEIGLFTGTQWYLDLVHANNVPAVPTISGGNMRGYPIAGDFDGNGTDDLGTFFGNTFYFDFNLDGNADATIAFGFPGVLDRPVAADLDQDGIDDVGLWVPGRSGVTPEKAGEFYFLMSNDPAGVKRVPGTVATLNHRFSPAPLGDDMFAQFGDEFASPIVGNFDPPVTPGGGNPTPAADQTAWLQNLYGDVAGRAAQEHELAYWSGKIVAGMNQQSVASSLLAGPEYRGRVINGLYQNILGRGVEAAGLSYWLDVWARRGGPEIVEASLYGSAEYFANHGGNNTGFIQGLYADVLGRAAAASEMAYWQNALRSSSRTAVAMGFATSNELRLSAIQSWYQEYLGRDADPASRIYWLNQLRSGATQQQVISAILGSAEYNSV